MRDDDRDKAAQPMAIIELSQVLVVIRQHIEYVVSMSILLNAIRKEIDRRSESLNAIARASGISTPQLSRLMKGERGLSIETAEKLANYLGLRIRIEQPRKLKSR